MNKEENIKNYYKNKFVNKKLKEKYLKKRVNIIDRIIDNLRIRAFNYKKKLNITNKQLLGCSKEELKIFLENKFTESMTFNNYGDWEIDHIKPVSSFDLTDNEEIKKCFHFSNLQPVWKIDNRRKSNKIL